MKEIPFVFKKYLFIYLTLGFIAFTVIGTLSHEFGHYAVAKYFGWNPRIGYAYTTFEIDSNNEMFYSIKKIQIKRFDEISNHKSYPEKEEYENLMGRFRNEDKIITFGGPIETLLSSIIGLTLLIIFRKKISIKESLSFTNWLDVFIALFILRQSANMVVALGSSILISNPHHRGDEFKIAYTFGLNPWSIVIASGIVGLLALAWIIFRIIPISERFTFILSGIFGGVSGYILWLILLGPIILP
ncbi:MAG: hypothetical protein WCO28_00275 [Bacteroidota bacterium]